MCEFLPRLAPGDSWGSKCPQSVTRGRSGPFVGFSHLPILAKVGTMKMEKTMVAKLVDSKGRIVLDKSYAGSTMLVDQRADGTIVLRPAVTVPANEAWLWKNKKALAMVQEGLAEARQGKHVAGPDMAAARKLAARIKD